VDTFARDFHDGRENNAPDCVPVLPVRFRAFFIPPCFRSSILSCRPIQYARRAFFYLDCRAFPVNAAPIRRPVRQFLVNHGYSLDSLKSPPRFQFICYKVDSAQMNPFPRLNNAGVREISIHVKLNVSFCRAVYSHSHFIYESLIPWF